MKRFPKLAAAIAAASLLAAPAGLAASMTASSNPAKASPAMHVRGTILALDGSDLKVKERDGSTVDVRLAKGWGISGIKAAKAEDIRKGDFVGIASVPGAGGGSNAVEVLIFPKAMKGTGEGSYPWDLTPKSRMTNATVSNLVQQVDGRTLTLTYNGGQHKTITVPAATPIVTFAPASPTDLTDGAHVFVPATKLADGTISAGHVVVGNNGIVPPM